MNWEVSSMQLKTSFFNPTLFQKNLTRSWPLWGGVSAVGSLVPLYLMLAVMNQIRLDRSDFTEILLNAAAYILPMFTFVYALLVAMFVWNYLHNSRSVGMMHSLAISRTSLFVTNMASGLAMLLIPYVIVGGLLCLVAACCNALDGMVMLQTIASVLLETLLFFGIGTLCAMVTGNVLAVAMFYMIANFIAPLMDVLIQSLAETFIFGITISTVDVSKWFAPLVALYDTVDVVQVETGETTWIPVLEGFWLIIVYGLVGAALLALSWWLYRFRRSESAGDVVAYTWLRPIFRYGIACISSLTLGRVLYELFWNMLFYDRHGAIAPMCICMMISAVVGYYGASMLLDKSLRVFRGSLKKVAVVCAAVVVLCLAVALDLFGVERYVPAAEDVASVEIWGCVDLICDSETMPGAIEGICGIHEAIIADQDYIENYTEWNYRSITIRYHLKNGSEVYRGYLIPIEQERAKNPDTYEGKIYALITDPEVLTAAVSIPQNARYSLSYLEFYNPELMSWESLQLDGKQWESVYAALLRDAAEGNFLLGDAYLQEWKYQMDSDKYFYHEAVLYVEYKMTEKTQDEQWSHYNMIHVYIQPTMKHTLAALKSAGVITQDTINSWYESEKYDVW